MKRFFFLFLFFNNLQRLSIALLETDFVKFPILVFPCSSSRLYEKDVHSEICSKNMWIVAQNGLPEIRIVSKNLLSEKDK